MVTTEGGYDDDFSNPSLAISNAKSTSSSQIYKVGMAKKKAKRVDINAEPSLLEDIDRSVREQNRFLDYCVAHNIEITLYLESGTQFIGFINGYDLKCILLGAKNVKKPARLILKSYISLIRANAPIELFIEYRGLGTAKTRKRKKRTEL